MENEQRKFDLHVKQKEFELKQREREFEFRFQDRNQNNNDERHFDAAKNIRLVPRFHEKNVENFFPQFEKVAESLKWPKEVWPTLLQSVLFGRAAHIYSSMSIEDSTDYEKVKVAILRGYELVPEAYRQKFRNYKKIDSQTFVEFARESSSSSSLLKNSDVQLVMI